MKDSWSIRISGRKFDVILHTAGKAHVVPKTEEEKKYLSENSPKYWLGKKRDPETVKKVSQTKKENGITQNQLARILGVSQGLISQI